MSASLAPSTARGTTSHTYDARGNLLTRVDPHQPGEDAALYTTTYTYDSRDLITTVVQEWEEKSYNDRQADVVTDNKILSDGGMEFVDHPTAEAGAAYQKLADDAAWARMYERIEGAGAGADMYNALRKHYANDG